MWLPAEVGTPLTWTPPQQVGTYQESHPIFDIFPSAGFPHNTRLNFTTV